MVITGSDDYRELLNFGLFLRQPVASKDLKWMTFMIAYFYNVFVSFLNLPLYKNKDMPYRFEMSAGNADENRFLQYNETI